MNGVYSRSASAKDFVFLCPGAECENATEHQGAPYLETHHFGKNLAVDAALRPLIQRHKGRREQEQHGQDQKRHHQEMYPRQGVHHHPAIILRPQLLRMS